DGIERIVKAAALGAGAPEPTVGVDPGQFTPALSNDGGLVRKLVPVLKETVGAENVQERPMSMGGEDFSVFVRAGIPGFYFFLGSAEPEAVAAARREGGKPLATTHSDIYYPVPEPTIKTGVEPGEFVMGQGDGPPKSRDEWTARDWDEAPAHKVKMTKAFYLGATEVTNAQYEQFDPEHKKYRGKNGVSTADDEPVTYVTWPQ